MISYLQVENLSKSFGERIIIEDITFGISKDQKVALIAKNGAGKTTLLNIISGEDTTDNGRLTFRNDLKIGYLSQLPSLDEKNTVLQEILYAQGELQKIVLSYHDAQSSNDINEQSKAIELMDHHNAWDYESKIETVLTRLNIKNLDQPVKELSGGERKRLALAKILLDEPDLMILDEPTNHLDLPMVEWLEEYLSKSKVTLLMVTHDRFFLDRVCNEIIEIDDYKLFRYKGNYSYFLKKRAERIHALEQEIEKAKNILRKEEEWMRRMPKARSHKAQYRIDNYYNLKETASKKTGEKSFDINIKSQRIGKKILELYHISKSFDDKQLIRDFSYKFVPKEKIGIVGPNGAGKTTFLNLITNNLELDSGEIEIGQTIKFGYYKQEGLSFRKDQRVIDIVDEIASVVYIGGGRSLSTKEFLTYFLFPPKMHYVQVDKLSGGEKRRLFLITVLMRNPNFLILDEPTNDLDIMTLAVLEDYLLSFDGCVVIVSHDRFFMDQVVDHIFAFDGIGNIKDFPGNYSQYRKHKDNIKQQQPVEKKEKKKPKQESKEKLKLSYNEKREFEQLTKEIEAMEEEKRLIEEEMNKGDLGHELLQEKSVRISELMNLIDEKTNRWLELSEFE